MLNQYQTDTMKISFVLFDEIEKTSDSFWNLLLGILDKATLAPGDNQKVDFSRAIIPMTTNLGSSEMKASVSHRFGFGARERAERFRAEPRTRTWTRRFARTGVAAARRRFTPEFINPLDKIVTFKPLGSDQLSQNLDIELKSVQQRILNASPQRSFLFEVARAARAPLLSEGTDARYGVHHLKRAIERLLLQPISNLIATRQVCGGDRFRGRLGTDAGSPDVH